jgi:hypothetical protein
VQAAKWVRGIIKAQGPQALPYVLRNLQVIYPEVVDGVLRVREILCFLIGVLIQALHYPSHILVHLATFSLKIFDNLLSLHFAAREFTILR